MNNAQHELQKTIGNPIQTDAFEVFASQFTTVLNAKVEKLDCRLDVLSTVSRSVSRFLKVVIIKISPSEAVAARSNAADSTRIGPGRMRNSHAAKQCHPNDAAPSWQYSGVLATNLQLSYA